MSSFKGSDGALPVAGLNLDASGNLYGTASEGGASQLGTVFKLDTAHHLTVLHSFTGGKDGANPLGPLLLKGGKLYGAADGGGTYNSGTVFEITP